tara:strand:- start:411 stop:821 length:411 start_codon:yes stop_codon:yes gene_type:complete
MEQIKPVDGMAVYMPSSSSTKNEVEPTAVKNVAPQFVSVKGNMDPKTGVFVTEVRDGGDGKVDFQYPSQKAAAAYSRSNKDENADNETKSKPTSTSTQEVVGSKPSSSTESTVESKQPVEASASAEAVTDGTKGEA